jgi:hypothetical protein
MKNLLVVFFAFLSINAFAELSSPFSSFRGDVQRALNPATNGEKIQRMYRGTYDVAAQGGTSGSTYNLGITLPAKSIIRQAWFYVKTQFVSAGNGTIALSCEDANNIFSAANITGTAADAITAGVPTGVASTMAKGIAANCNVIATIASSAYTAGVLNLFLEVVQHD